MFGGQFQLHVRKHTFFSQQKNLPRMDRRDTYINVAPDFKKSHDNKYSIISLALSLLREYWFLFFCFKFMDLSCCSVHKLAKIELDQYISSSDLTLAQY